MGMAGNFCLRARGFVRREGMMRCGEGLSRTWGSMRLRAGLKGGMKREVGLPSSIVTDMGRSATSVVGPALARSWRRRQVDDELELCRLKSYPIPWLKKYRAVRTRWSGQDL